MDILHLKRPCSAICRRRCSGRDIVKVITCLLLLFVFVQADTPKSAVVKTLPGYSAGDLPFKLETGYITVGEKEDLELFYYFIESERDPESDPLILWLTGGPGCSGFSSLIYEFGPLKFDYEAFDGWNLPNLLLNQYSWTKIANIIFLDAPAGTGFSYATTPDGYHSTDTNTTQDAYTFLIKWLEGHPNFIKNRLYIGGESYAGLFVPLLTFKVAEGIEAGLKPLMNLQGYLIGNGLTDNRIDVNARIPAAHRLGLLSDEYFEALKLHCNGEYTNPDPTNAWCLYALQFYRLCTRNIYMNNVLEPSCKKKSPKPPQLELGDESLISLPHYHRPYAWCRPANYEVSPKWANNPAVQEALHIRNGTIKVWARCNPSLPFDSDVDSVIHYHKLLITKGFEALVFSGDHDLLIPYTGTLQWIRLLNLTVDDNWRPWLVGGQVAGYTERYIYEKTRSRLVFATVKGAGHTAPEYKPKETLAMVDRFFNLYPL